MDNYYIAKIEIMDHDRPDFVIDEKIVLHDTIGQALDGVAPNPGMGAIFRVTVISDSAYYRRVL